MNNIAVIIETRDSVIDDLILSINSVIEYTGWDVMLFYCNNDVSKINNCSKVKLPNDIDLNRYNQLLKSVTFWESFDQENILVFQSDSRMLRSGIDDYIGYGYVGAPFIWASKYFKDPRYEDLSIFSNGGNGGFSLRKKSVMLDILDKYYDNPSDMDRYLNEDMFFSKYISEYKYPDINMRKKFCVETMFIEDPIAVHSVDKYLSSSELKKLFSNGNK